MAEFSTLRAQEGSISPFIGYTTDGRGQIYLHASAFDGESSLFPLEDVLSHAFIHQAGITKQPGRLGRLRHDSTWIRVKRTIKSLRRADKFAVDWVFLI